MIFFLLIRSSLTRKRTLSRASSLANYLRRVGRESLGTRMERSYPGRTIPHKRWLRSRWSRPRHRAMIKDEEAGPQALYYTYVNSYLGRYLPCNGYVQHILPYELAPPWLPVGIFFVHDRTKHTKAQHTETSLAHRQCHFYGRRWCFLRFISSRAGP